VRVAFRKRKVVPMIGAPAAGLLAEALAAVPDPRRPYGWEPGHEPMPLVAFLDRRVVALTCRARSQSAVAKWERGQLEDEPPLDGSPLMKRPRLLSASVLTIGQCDSTICDQMFTHGRG